MPVKVSSTCTGPQRVWATLPVTVLGVLEDVVAALAPVLGAAWVVVADEPVEPPDEPDEPDEADDGADEAPPALLDELDVLVPADDRVLAAGATTDASPPAAFDEVDV